MNQAKTAESSYLMLLLFRSNYRGGICHPGSYELYISVGTRAGTPQIALPLSDSDGSRRYRLGVLKVNKKG